MKNNHRLMKIVEIESNYQKHRQRLLSIQHINARKKQASTNLKPNETNIKYKESKLKADIFSYKEKYNQIQYQNQLLLNKIGKQYGKTSDKNIRSNIVRSESSQSVRSIRSERSIQDENTRIYQKINKTKSIYSKIRKQSRNSSALKLNTSKEEIMNLLVNQLGVKPTVLLPNLSKRSPHHRANQYKTVNLRQNAGNNTNMHSISSIRKKHSLTNSILPKK